eukprot:CAMPEP_0194087680 /NCGR_PEP_ID=MMETSP0149-20130528/26109_1 /TAXON_ID=122233 /ORGANISM="Chaetoceros debilis, Strain MM31A-1" /LENGTH=417 /DNA_ID=CAMNT_0038771129 /DNA_START=192 /DNA_END=1445 /DNA_ORIENTATION=+
MYATVHSTIPDLGPYSDTQHFDYINQVRYAVRGIESESIIFGEAPLYHFYTGDNEVVSDLGFVCHSHMAGMLKLPLAKTIEGGEALKLLRENITRIIEEVKEEKEDSCSCTSADEDDEDMLMQTKMMLSQANDDDSDHGRKQIKVVPTSIKIIGGKNERQRSMIYSNENFAQILFAKMWWGSTEGIILHFDFTRLLRMFSTDAIPMGIGKSKGMSLSIDMEIAESRCLSSKSDDNDTGNECDEDSFDHDQSLPDATENDSLNEIKSALSDKSLEDAYEEGTFRSCAAVSIKSGGEKSEAEKSSKSVVSGKSLGDAKCVICFERPKTFAFVPCGHVCLCEKCARRPPYNYDFQDAKVKLGGLDDGSAVSFSEDSRSICTSCRSNKNNGGGLNNTLKAVAKLVCPVCRMASSMIMKVYL